MGRRTLPAILAALAVVAAAWLLLRGEWGAPGSAPVTGIEAGSRRDPAGRRPASPPSRAPGGGEFPRDAVPAPSARGAALRVMVTEVGTGEPVDTAVAGLHLENAGNWSAFSHDDGSIRFAELPEAAGTVSVNARGFLEGTAPVALVEGAEVVVAVALHPEPTVTGRVLAEATGKPVAGAEVWATDRPFVPDWERQVSPVRAGPDGIWSLRVGVPGARVTVKVRAPGFLEAIESVPLPTLGNEPVRVETRLLSGGAIAGVVRDADGIPVAGALVTVLPAGNGFRPPSAAWTRVVGPPESGLLARTGEDGSFRRDGLAAGGLYRVYASTLRPPAWGAEERVLVPEVGGEALVDLRLQPGGRLLVTWKFPEGEEGPGLAPTTSVRGIAGPAWSFDEMRRAMMGAGGEVQVRDPAESWTLDVPPGTFSVTSLGPRWGGRVTVAVLPGETVSAVLELAPGLDRSSSIEGTVVDDLGNPVRAAPVSATPVGGPREGGPDPGAGGAWMVNEFPSTGAAADREGRFRFRSLEKGRTYRLQVLGSASSREVVAPAEGVVLEMLRRAGLRGRAVPAPGVPSAGVLDFHLEVPDGSGGWRPLFGGSVGWSEGRFSTPMSLPGPLRLWLRRGTLVGGPVEAILAPGEVKDIGDIPLRAGSPLVGRLADPAGRPVGGASLALGTPNQEPVTCVTGADGSFDLGVRPPVPWPVTVTGDACVPTVLTLDPAAPAPLVLTVPRGALLRGRVRDGAGLPAAGAVVEATPAGGGEPSRLPVDHLGRFEARMAAGVYQLMIHLDGTATPAGSVRLEDGGASDLALTAR